MDEKKKSDPATQIKMGNFSLQYYSSVYATHSLPVVTSNLCV